MAQLVHLLHCFWPTLLTVSHLILVTMSLRQWAVSGLVREVSRTKAVTLAGAAVLNK